MTVASAPRRTPAPPPAIDEWCERYGGIPADARGEALLEGAERALGEALARPGRNREGAFALLAADALLTYACEDAARAERPGAELLGILERLREPGGP